MAENTSTGIQKVKAHPEWDGFNKGIWQKDIDIRDFIQQNYTPYSGDDSFPAGATERTKMMTISPSRGTSIN